MKPKTITYEVTPKPGTLEVKFMDMGSEGRNEREALRMALLLYSRRDFTIRREERKYE